MFCVSLSVVRYDCKRAGHRGRSSARYGSAHALICSFSHYGYKKYKLFPIGENQNGGCIMLKDRSTHFVWVESPLQNSINQLPTQLLFPLLIIQLKQLGRTIQLGGGAVILMEEGDKQMFSMLTKPTSIVMYADPEDNTQGHTQEMQDSIREVMKHLKK